MQENELFDRYFEGTLTSEEVQEFKRRLREDPEFGKSLVDFAVETSLLVRVGSQIEELSRQGQEGILAPPQPKGFRIKLAVPLALAAGALLAAGVWWFAAGRGGSEGSEVWTGKGQTLALKFEGEDTVVEVSENTRLRVVGGAVVTGAISNAELVKAGLGKVIQMASGSIKVSAAKQTEGRSFIVKTTQAEIRVVGTRFSVGVGIDKKQTRVDVQEGVVNVRQIPDGMEVAVGAGVWARVEEGMALELSEKAIRQVDEFLLPEEIGRAAGQSMYGNGFAFDGKFLWLINTGTALLYSVDPKTRSIQTRTDLSGNCRSLLSLAAGGDSLWGAGKDRSGHFKLFRINTSSGQCEGTDLTGEAEDCSLAYGGGYLWLCQNSGRGRFTLIRIDPATRRVLSSVGIRESFRPDTPPTLMWLNGGPSLLAPGGIIVRLDPNHGNALVRNGPLPSKVPERGYSTATSGTASGFWVLRFPSRRVIQFECSSASAGLRQEASPRQAGGGE